MIKDFLHALIRFCLVVIIFCCVWFFMSLTAYIVNEFIGFDIDRYCCLMCGMLFHAFIDSLKGKQND